MTAKLPRYAALAAAAGLTAVCLRAPAAAAALTGGAMKITSLATYSGGRMASYGASAAKAINIGASTASGACLRGGQYCLSLGGTPGVITYTSAKTDLSSAHCYPVPFKPSAGHTKITFTGLTRFARIRIYTISGELVRTLDKFDAGESVDWNVHNSGGAKVDSGVYIFLIKNGSQTKKGKLMIIR
jgi:hypothetical protein